MEVRDSRELENAFETMGRERPDALLLLADPPTLSQRLRIVEFAAEAEREPVASGSRHHGRRPEQVFRYHRAEVLPSIP